MNAPNCYECVYRGSIPGDCHSRCNHPEVKSDGNYIDALIGFISGENIEAIKKLKIKGNLHGIKSGWFMWPVNFDPTWLENCEGFKKKE